jgi:phasin
VHGRSEANPLRTSTGVAGGASGPDQEPPLKGLSVMTVVTPANIKAKTEKVAGSSFGLPNSEIPKFDLSKMEMPAAFREFAEKGVAQAKSTYENAKAATEEATDLLKGTYKTAAKGATDYNLKVIEIARTNTNSAFEYAYKLMGVKSPSEFVELSTAHAHKQFEAITAQTRELTELAQKVTTEIAAPIKSGITKAFNNKFPSS